MTDSTLHLKNKRKEKRADAPLEVPKHEKADLHERRPPKKPKDFKLQYKGREGTPVHSTHPDWKHLDAYHTLEIAQAYAKGRMNGNALHRMFDYRILDKDGKECPL